MDFREISKKLFLCFFIVLSSCQTEKQVYISQLNNAPNWNEKLLIGIRQNFIKKNYLESWRVSQIARVIYSDIENLEYYLALAAAKQGVCPIGLYPIDSVENHLLAAYGYRFRSRYRGESSVQSPYSLTSARSIASQLEKNRNFYLKDIKKAKIIKRSGCLFQKNKLDDLKLSEKQEFLHLLGWYSKFINQPDTDKKIGHQSVIYRLFDLALDYGDEEDSQMLVSYFKAYKESDWLETSEPERTLIWGMLADSEAYLEIPLVKNDKKIQLVNKIILKSINPEATNWLGAIEFKSFNYKQQIKLIDHLLSIDGVEKKNWLLNQKMIALYKLGKVGDTLSVVRELTVDGESENEQAIENNAIYIASELFSEFRYDKKLLGTIQSSLPSTYWVSVYRNMMFHHAMAGNRVGYNAIYKTLKKNNSLNRIRLKKNQLNLLKALTSRNKKTFKRILFSAEKKHWKKKEMLKLFDELVLEVMSLSDKKRLTLTPFLQVMADFAFRNMKRDNNLKKLEFLLSLLDKNRKLDWNLGSQAIRKGSQNIGVVNIANSKIIESEFIWEDNFSLPRRDLLIVPDKIIGKGWEIR